MQNTLDYPQKMGLVKSRELFIGSINSWKHYHGKDWAQKLCHYVMELIARVDKLPYTPGKFPGKFVTPHQPAPFQNM